MKIRNSILTIAEKLEKRLSEQEQYCKENNYSKPYLEIHVAMTHIVPASTKKNWTQYAGEKKYMDITHITYFSL